MLYVGLKRDWKSGSVVLFTRRSDFILGSGVVAGVQQLDELESAERELCLQRNWSAKMHFGSLARFVPPVPIKATPLALQSPMSLHGSEISIETATNIEDLASVRVFT